MLCHGSEAAILVGCRRLVESVGRGELLAATGAQILAFLFAISFYDLQEYVTIPTDRADNLFCLGSCILEGFARKLEQSVAGLSAVHRA